VIDHVKALTPRKIVAELDKYIIGQGEAKRAVAVAIRNRWRRRMIEGPMKNEVLPKNIIMIGPTGVGKTEIARRLANLVEAPFLKVEASKYTEVGYVGRDAESMVRDLVEVAMSIVRQREVKQVEQKAEEAAEERILDILLPAPSYVEPEDEERRNQRASTREKLRAKLRAHELEDREITISIENRSNPMMQIFSNAGIEHMAWGAGILDKLAPKKMEDKTMTVGEARKILAGQEAERLVDEEKIRAEALELAQNSGIVFIDEIDKIAASYQKGAGPDVSREGVQRDLLPIVEGTTVYTRHGVVRTDHVLFIAAGAFNIAKPSDLIPELQGRFPIRVELKNLSREDFTRIITEPENALTKQYAALLGVEGVKVTFGKDSIAEIARIAEEVNSRSQNIGARRLHTVFEKLLEDLLFESPDMDGAAVKVDAAFVVSKLKDIAENEDLSKYIL
jgi:ATP-dependent HslUV protease ATP-binding subunit HslU